MHIKWNFRVLLKKSFYGCIHNDRPVLYDIADDFIKLLNNDKNVALIQLCFINKLIAFAFLFFR